MNKYSLYHRDTWAEIQLDNISENIKNMLEHLPKEVDIVAVVKANAYGHGYIQVAKTAIKAGAKALAVAFLDEALLLREKGIAAPILVLGATRTEDASLAAEYRISLTVFQKEWLEEVVETLPADHSLAVHIKCDTGMGRIGVRNSEELKEIEQIVLENSSLVFEGIYTHFASADELNDTYFKEQLRKFQSMIHVLKGRPSMIHSANSAAAIRHPDSFFNAVRMGIAMYGLAPSKEIREFLPFPLKPAFSLKTRLINVKQVKQGDKISYGSVYQASSDEWIGTLPIGYADGWIRKLQGQEVLVEGIRVPIVGKICMDQCMVRLPHYIKPGAEVVLIGLQNNDFISADEIATNLETINYEITCMIAQRVPRVYYENGVISGVDNPLLKNVETKKRQ
jgi:alanine racemase